jgi:dephospho-CoA kinase
MNSAKRLFFFSATVLSVMSFSGAARAGMPLTAISATVANEVRQPGTTNTQAAPAAAKSAISKPSNNPFGSQPVSNNTLNAKRGGERVFNDAELKGVVSNNVASNLTTGMNVISEGAFSGSSGLPLVVQNSGNNVLIQNSTIVNVQLK